MNISIDVDTDMDMDMDTYMNMEMDTGVDMDTDRERTRTTGIWGVKKTFWAKPKRGQNSPFSLRAETRYPHNVEHREL
jgi:hypothetical protein